MSRWHALVLSAASSALFVVPSGAAAQDADPEGTLAIVGATVHPVDGDPVVGATLLVRGGRIAAVGLDVPIPPGARRIDAQGHIVTPGFVAVESALGLVEIGSEPSTVDAEPKNGDGADGDDVRAAFHAADGFDPRSTVVPVARSGGVTSAIVVPTGGLVSGTSAAIDLLGDAPADMLVARAAAVHVRLDPSGGWESGRPAMPAAVSRLRTVLDDARLYARNRAAYDRRGLRELHVSRRDLERLTTVLDGTVPLVVRVSRAADILRTLALAEEYGVRLVLAGAEEGWRVAGEIARADVPVIVQPLTNLPSSFTRLASRYDNAARLDAAGVRVILETDGPHGLRNLRQEAGNAVAHGLDRGTALRALTLEPARTFGLPDRGTVAPGQMANLVVWSDDPFELTSRPLHVFIRGREASLRTRQTALFERYRQPGAGASTVP